MLFLQKSYTYAVFFLDIVMDFSSETAAEPAAAKEVEENNSGIKRKNPPSPY